MNSSRALSRNIVPWKDSLTSPGLVLFYGEPFIYQSLLSAGAGPMCMTHHLLISNGTVLYPEILCDRLAFLLMHKELQQSRVELHQCDRNVKE